MKKWIIVLAAVLLMVSNGMAQEKQKLRIAVEGAYRPFNYIDPNGELKGFDVDIAYVLCDKIGAQCELVQQDWDGMIPGLLAKKYDVICSSMSITEKRKQAVSFTDAYYKESARFVARKDSGLDISKEGLKGKTIGVQRATTWADYLKAVYGDSINIKYYDTVQEHNLDLTAGRLDAVMSLETYMATWLESPEGKDFAFFGPSIRDEKYLGEGVGIVVRKDDTELQKQLNDALHQIIADGTHKKLASKYFTVDIYDY